MLDRRDFLKKLSYAAVGITLMTPRRLLSETSNNCIIVGGLNCAAQINLTSNSVRCITTGFTTHSLVRVGSTQQYAALTFRKNGALVNFDTLEMKPLRGGDDFVFYGHGYYDHKQELLVLTAVNTISGKGHLLSIDPKTQIIEDNVVVTPGSLHECHFLADGNLMIASSGIVLTNIEAYSNVKERRSPTALIVVDPLSGHKLHQVSLHEKNQSINHFLITKNNQILAQTGWYDPKGNFLGHIYLTDNLSGPLRRLEWPHSSYQPARGEMLSAALNDDHSIALITCPVSHTLSVVNLNQGIISETSSNGSPWVVYDAERKIFVTNNDLQSLNLSYIFSKRGDDHSSKEDTSTEQRVLAQNFSGAHALFV